MTASSVRSSAGRRWHAVHFDPKSDNGEHGQVTLVSKRSPRRYSGGISSNRHAQRVCAIRISRSTSTTPSSPPNARRDYRVASPRLCRGGSESATRRLIPCCSRRCVVVSIGIGLRPRYGAPTGDCDHCPLSCCLTRGTGCGAFQLNRSAPSSSPETAESAGSSPPACRNRSCDVSACTRHYWPRNAIPATLKLSSGLLAFAF